SQSSNLSNNIATALCLSIIIVVLNKDKHF
ncbi:MAG: hypothetical protein ACI81T_001121, partial [Bacteroidia bacterium]